MTDGPLPDLHFSCPKCGQHLKCEFDLAGTETDCPLCSAVFNIPAGDHSGTDTVIEVTRTTPRKPRRKLPIVIALGMIAFVALLAGVFVLLSGRGPARNSPRHAQQLFADASARLETVRSSSQSFKAAYSGFEEVLAILDQILEYHPTTDVAFGLISGTATLGGFSLESLRTLRPGMSFLHLFEMDQRYISVIASELIQSEYDRGSFLSGIGKRFIEREWLSRAELFLPFITHDLHRDRLIIDLAVAGTHSFETEAPTNFFARLNQHFGTQDKSAYYAASGFLHRGMPEMAAQYLGRCTQFQSHGHLLRRLISVYEALSNHDKASHYNKLFESLYETDGLSHRIFSSSQGRERDIEIFRNRDFTVSLLDLLALDLVDQALKMVQQSGRTGYQLSLLVDLALRHDHHAFALQLVLGVEGAVNIIDFARVSSHRKTLHPELLPSIVERTANLTGPPYGNLRFLCDLAVALSDLRVPHRPEQKEAVEKVQGELLLQAARLIPAILNENRSLLGHSNLYLAKAYSMSGVKGELGYRHFKNGERSLLASFADKSWAHLLQPILEYHSINGNHVAALALINRLIDQDISLGADTDLEIAKASANLGYLVHALRFIADSKSFDRFEAVASSFYDSQHVPSDVDLKILLPRVITDDHRRFFRSEKLRSHQALTKW